MRNNTSPDGKWKIFIEDNMVQWVKLSEHEQEFTTEEIIKAMQSICPEAWEK